MKIMECEKIENQSDLKGKTVTIFDLKRHI